MSMNNKLHRVINGLPLTVVEVLDNCQLGLAVLKNVKSVNFFSP